RRCMCPACWLDRLTHCDGRRAYQSRRDLAGLNPNPARVFGVHLYTENAAGVGDVMGDYTVVVVGTDGSDSSLRAVDQAGAIAAERGAKLIVATAYLPKDEHHSGDPDQLNDENYRTEGNAPVYGMLREAGDRARAAGAKDVEERAIAGAPIDVLVDLVAEVNADLLVVGNVGVNSIAGRLLGSVPRAVSRRAKTEV